MRSDVGVYGLHQVICNAYELTLGLLFYDRLLQVSNDPPFENNVNMYIVVLKSL